MINFKILEYIPKKLKNRVKLLIPLLSISGTLEVVSLALLIPLVNLVLHPSGSSKILELVGINNFSDAQKLVVVFTIFIFVIIIKGIFVFFVSKFTFTTALKIKVSFQNRLCGNYLSKSLLSHLESNSANYLRNITTECHQIEGRFIMPGLTLLAELLPVLFIAGFLIYLNPLGVFIASIVFITAGLIITKTTSKYLKAYGKEQIYSDGMQIKIAKEAFNSIKEISLYKKEGKILDIYKLYTHRSAVLISKALALGQIPKFILEIIGILAIALISCISFSKGSTGHEVLIELAVFMGAIVKLLPSANRIVMNFQSLTHAKPAIENIVKELETKSVNKGNDIEDTQCIAGFDKIQLKDLFFKYPKGKDYVLKDINLEIKKGQIVGIKGESGSGKSTLINLLLGLFETTKGKIIINGSSIENCKKSWQNIVAYVPQEVILFDDTLRNNIVFYQDNILDDTIKDVFKKIKLEDFIDKLDMNIGENGSSLSGGQKQRIGIARALVRSPQFIVFDEATSALDVETEQEINKLMKEIGKDVTVLVIAHKLSALKICDKVYQIKNRFKIT